MEKTFKQTLQFAGFLMCAKTFTDLCYDIKIGNF